MSYSIFKHLTSQLVLHFYLPQHDPMNLNRDRLWNVIPSWAIRECKREIFNAGGFDKAKLLPLRSHLCNFLTLSAVILSNALQTANTLDSTSALEVEASLWHIFRIAVLDYK